MKVMLIEPPVSNLEAPGVIMPVTAAALRAAGHDVIQWNAGAEIIDGLLTCDSVRDAAARARETAGRLAAEPKLDRLAAARLLACLDSAPMADLLCDHIDAFKLSLRNGVPSGPLAGVAYNTVQAALEIHLAPFFPERISFATRHRFQPQYVTTYSHRTASDLIAAARARDLFWNGPFRDIAAPRVAQAAPDLQGIGEASPEGHRGEAGGPDPEPPLENVNVVCEDSDSELGNAQAQSLEDGFVSLWYNECESFTDSGTGACDYLVSASDVCKNENILYEQTCGNDDLQTEEVVCANSCSAGKCL